MVMLVKKALYGLKESGLLWYNNIRSKLGAMGYMPIEADPCAFTRTVSGKVTSIVLIYVDDILIASRKAELNQDFFRALSLRYGEIKPQAGGKIGYVGATFTINRTEGTIFVNCAGYAAKVTEKFGVTKGSPTPLPCDYNPKQGFTGEDDEATDSTEYREKVMSLLYLAKKCRPEILYAASTLATHSQNPKIGNLGHAHRVLRYVYSHQDEGILLSKAEHRGLIGHADCSFNHHPDGKSHGGIGIELAGGIVISKSYKIQTVVKDTNEGEIVVADNSMDILFWAANACVELGLETPAPLKLMQDNSSAIVTMNRGRVLRKRGHLNVRFAYIKEMIDTGQVIMVKEGTINTRVDGLTKSNHSYAEQMVSTIVY
jgi:hypothetical protein